MANDLPKPVRLLRRLPPGAAAVFGALVLLGIAMAAVRIPFRNQLRQQLAVRDARVLAALIQQELDDPENPAAGDDPLAAIIAASIVPDLPGVETVQAYSPEGRLFATFLGDTNAAPLPKDFSESSTQPMVGFRPKPQPRLDVWIPLRPSGSTEVVGFTFLTLDGQDLAQEYARLDASLLRQVWVAFVLIGATLAFILLRAFRSLDRANRLLADRSARLEQANRELSLAARTSAIGAVASHLVHGLRNPLAALQSVVANGGDSRDAADSARRMRAMIDDVVRVLRDEQGLAGFEIPVFEIIQESVRRIRNHPSCRSSTRWETTHTEGPLLENRNANLTLLILENLGTNAAQALEVGGSIRIRADYREPNWEFVVEDDGPGLPPDLGPRLFTPMSSTKTGGSGLGLAISRQLARHMGGDLDLVSSVPGCTRFRLRVPCPQPASSLQALHSVTAQ